MTNKICNKCGKNKPLELFYFADKRKGTYRGACKDCDRILTNKNRAYRKKMQKKETVRLANKLMGKTLRPKKEIEIIKPVKTGVKPIKTIRHSHGLSYKQGVHGGIFYYGDSGWLSSTMTVQQFNAINS